MRLSIELFLLAVVVWLGWSTSFQDRVNHIRGVEATPPAAAAHQTQLRQALDGSITTTPAAPRQPFVPRSAPARPAATISNGDWMWDSAHRSSLDRGAYKTGDSSAQRAGQNYWIDSRGVRHSVNATPAP